jgi:hypothetical protein
MDFERMLQLLAVLTTIGGMGTVLYVGVRYALARIKRIEREGDEKHLAAAAEVSGRFERLEQEVAELQDRLDFAERLLTRNAEPERLDAGKGFQ